MKWLLEITAGSDNLKLVFPSFFLIFAISKFQENILDSFGHLLYKFHFKKKKKLNFSKVRETLFLLEQVPHHKVQNQMSTDVILCSNLSEYIRLCIHNS